MVGPAAVEEEAEAVDGEQVAERGGARRRPSAEEEEGGKRGEGNVAAAGGERAWGTWRQPAVRSWERGT